MAKDLRGLLEPAASSATAKGSHGASCLAQRRSLASPGEPRVYRVRSGFVCGLCGKLHGGLDKAFECLGRCTIELRLRSPAGPTHQGNTAHFACTACGRGFVNCDDAEQCFERCLVKMKPTPQFEVALRRVQVRYMQRLASHGVRSLERIDPLTEHTKMLSTLTKEQRALSKASPEETHKPTQRTQPEARAVVNAARPPAAAASSSHAVSTPPQEALGLAEDSLANSATEGLTVPSEVQVLQDERTPAPNDTVAVVEAGERADGPVAAPSEEQADAAETVSAEGNIEAPTDSAETSESSASSESLDQAPALDEGLNSESLDEILSKGDEVLQEGLELASDALTAELEPDEMLSEQQSATETNMRAIVEGAAAHLDLSPEEASDAHKLFSGTENVGSRVAVEGASALTALASSTPETFNEVSEGARNFSAAGRGNAVAAEGLSSDISASLSALGSDAVGLDPLGGAFEEASEFASIAEQPSLNETMGADVLAILQAPPEGENLELNSKQERLLRDKTLHLDTSLLESVTSEMSLAPEVTELFVRKRDMKPYRRNNARYTCSACPRDYFTKEQVEACFYSHPEEGSEEERKLREKVEKIKAKSVA